MFPWGVELRREMCETRQLFVVFFALRHLLLLELYAQYIYYFDKNKENAS